MDERVHTVVIGAGQAGLATSYCLAQSGIDHVVLERASGPASAWHDGRWDSFALLTPNWTVRLPGADYRGPDPGGFMTRVEIIAYLTEYAMTYRMPVRYNTEVTAVEPGSTGRGYRVMTQISVLTADHVVVAIGLFQQPRIPRMAAALPAFVLQLSSATYRSPGQLPPGAALVVGTGQSGCQIAEELFRSGRKVYLSVGRAGRVPRRYRGRDIFEWLVPMGFLDGAPSESLARKMPLAVDPAEPGTAGDPSLNLHQLARKGAVLLGHLRGVDGNRLELAPDLAESLRLTDRLEAETLKMIDDYIARARIDAPPQRLAALRDGFEAPAHEALDLLSTGITSVVWCCGYTFDFSLIRLPVRHEWGSPHPPAMGQPGAPFARWPGLHFAGLPWLGSQRAGLLLGVRESAMSVAEAVSRNGAG